MTDDFQPETAEDVLRIIRTNHYDIAPCPCWICREARKLGIDVYGKDMSGARQYPEVRVADEWKEALGND